MTELPARVRAVCGTFLDAVPDGLVSGLYLRGGLAFGEWVDGKSDIDFTATLRRAPTTKDIGALRRAHEVVGSEWGPVIHFDGVHLLAIDLAEPPDACPDRPVVHMREFSDAGRFDLTPVPWHELARHGVTVVGPPVETLEVWTDDAVLRAFTIDNLDTYWRGQAAACLDPDLASTPFACEWVVPGIARLDHLLVTGEQTGKSLAARWGLTHYPERYHRVLREALWIREGAGSQEYDDVGERGRDVAEFAAYVVEQVTALL